MTKSAYSKVLIFSVSSVLIACTGGGEKGISAKLIENVSLQKSAVDVNMYAAHKTVCDPFGTRPDPRSNIGLVGELFYVSPTQNLSTPVDQLKVGDYFTQGYKSWQTIFLSQLNVPTRTFDKGFTTESGDSVRDDDDQILTEWFAMRFKTVIGLAEDEEEGMYQIAALSDDGSILRMQQNGVWETLIDNDGLHSTRMGCAIKPIFLGRDTEYLSEIQYYQGPRNHISMILMKRKLPAGGEKDPLCGVQSNSLYFDYTKNSTPAQGYRDLLTRGWSPLKAGNYSLPIQAVWNPCLDATKPEIKNFRISSVAGNTVTFEWETNIPATSQIVWTDVQAANTQVTTADNFLRTNHQVTMTVALGNTYTFQAASTAGSLGRAVSEPIERFFDIEQALV